MSLNINYLLSHYCKDGHKFSSDKDLDDGIDFNTFFYHNLHDDKLKIKDYLNSQQDLHSTFAIFSFVKSNDHYICTCSWKKFKTPGRGDYISSAICYNQINEDFNLKEYLYFSRFIFDFLQNEIFLNSLVKEGEDACFDIVKRKVSEFNINEPAPKEVQNINIKEGFLSTLQQFNCILSSELTINNIIELSPILILPNIGFLSNLNENKSENLIKTFSRYANLPNYKIFNSDLAIEPNLNIANTLNGNKDYWLNKNKYTNFGEFVSSLYEKLKRKIVTHEANLPKVDKIEFIKRKITQSNISNDEYFFIKELLRFYDNKTNSYYDCKISSKDLSSFMILVYSRLWTDLDLFDSLEEDIIKLMSKKHELELRNEIAKFLGSGDFVKYYKNILNPKVHRGIFDIFKKWIEYESQKYEYKHVQLFFKKILNICLISNELDKKEIIDLMILFLNKNFNFGD